MGIRVSMIDATVEVRDVLGALSEEDICELLEQLTPKRFDEVLRKRRLVPEPHPLDDVAADAIDLLRQGRADDALLVLERAVHPKWKTLAACEAAMRLTGRGW